MLEADPFMQDVLFPILTGLTLVFAGILVGYFLWFRDRSEQLILSEQLTTENERLNAELRSASSQSYDVEEQFSKLELQNTSLQQLCDDLLKSREKTQLHASNLETELYSARTKMDQMREELASELRKRAENDESLAHAKQDFFDKQSGIESTLQDRISKSETAKNRFENELKHQVSLNRQLEERLHRLNSENAELKSELDSQREILDVAKSNAAGLEKEHIGLESNLRSQLELLKESRGQTAAAISAKELAEFTLNENKQQIQNLNSKIDSLEHEVHAGIQLKERCNHLESSIELAQERIQSLLNQRDEFGGKLKENEQELTAVRNRSRNQLTTIEQLRQKLDTSELRIANEQEMLRKTIKQLESTNSESRSEIERLKRTVSDAESWRHKNDESFKRVSEENARLILQLSEFEKIDQDALVSSEEYKLRIDAAVKQRDSAFDELKELKAEIKRIKNHARSNEETIRILRRERGAILMRNREYASNSYPRIHNESLEFSKADQLSTEYGGTLKTDPVRGPVFVEAPRQHDDLKLIHGIAKVLEERLNEFGIYTFKQIMEWDDNAIEEFSELLAFKDRIERDDWLGQAAKLYYRKNRNMAA